MTARVPAGIPTGGRFAPSANDESTIDLARPEVEDPTPADLIDYLGQYGDGDRVSLDDLAAFYDERNGGDEDLARPVAEGALVDLVAPADARTAEELQAVFDQVAAEHLPSGPNVVGPVRGIGRRDGGARVACVEVVGDSWTVSTVEVDGAGKVLEEVEVTKAWDNPADGLRWAEAAAEGEIQPF